MILLNPGPVNVSDRVKKALTFRDICHRESECVELMYSIRKKLLSAFVPGSESDYTAILLTGSGTAAVESCLLSCLPMGKRTVVINNGIYGQRMSSINDTQRLGMVPLNLKWDERPDPDKIRSVLKQHPQVYALAFVHHETTLGLINPVSELAEVVDSLGLISVVDSVSGLGGELINIAGSHMYLVAGTAGKCIQGFPGVSFVLARKGFMERMKKFPKRNCYLNLSVYFEEQERGSVPFTPAVQLYAALDEALTELLEEGVENRAQRYGRSASLIRQRLEYLGVQAVLPAALQSNSLTAFYVPEGLTYEVLHDRLKERGFVIYAGQGHLESKIFRIANMGALQESDFENFLGAFQEIIEQEISKV